MAVLHAQRMQEHLLITEQHQTSLCSGNTGVNQTLLQHIAIILYYRHNDNCIFTALCLVDGGRIGMRDIVNLFPAVLNKNTVKIRRDAVFLMHVVIAVADFDDFSDISVVHLILRLILQLQNLVMLTEQTIAYLQLFFI